MSGDKLLGGPQAGIILGPQPAIASMIANPLTRALRVDKLTIAALQATLGLYRDPMRALREIPILAMLTTPAAEIRRRAEGVASLLHGRGLAADVVESDASVGGGAFPTARIESWAVALGGDPRRLEAAARSASTPVIGRISDGRFLLDMRTIPPRDDAAMFEVLSRTLGGLGA
jgi:L-seryl-tRNA(Ser) seleniumtransferase